MSPTLSVNGLHVPSDRHGTPLSPNETNRVTTAAAPRTPSPDEGNGRQANGRFAKGNRGGPGNPFARQTAALRRALCDAVTEDDIQAIARQLVTQAKLGHLAAIKLLFTYVLGKPTEAVNPDTLDVQEWQLYQQTPVTPEAMTTVLNSMHADLACTVVRAALPEMAKAQASQLAGQLDPEPTPTAATVEEQASEEPAPAAPAGVASASDDVRHQTGKTASTSSRPAVDPTVPRQQTGETGPNLLARFATLRNRNREEDAGSRKPSGGGGPSANGENGPERGSPASGS
jgi:hypothetical protein